MTTGVLPIPLGTRKRDIVDDTKEPLLNLHTANPEFWKLQSNLV